MVSRLLVALALPGGPFFDCPLGIAELLLGVLWVRAESAARETPETGRAGEATAGAATGTAAGASMVIVETVPEEIVVTSAVDTSATGDDSAMTLATGAGSLTDTLGIAGREIVSIEAAVCLGLTA